MLCFPLQHGRGHVAGRSTVVAQSQAVPPSPSVGPPRRAEAPPMRPPARGSSTKDPSGSPQQNQISAKRGVRGPPATPGGFRGPNSGPGRPGSNGSSANSTGRSQDTRRPQNNGSSPGSRPRPQTQNGMQPQSARQPQNGRSQQGKWKTHDSRYVLNSDIPFEEVRVLDKAKEMIGVMSLQQVLGMASAQQCDVILLNDTASPPLVRMCSLSKYKYELEKVKKVAAKQQRASQQEFKELKLSPRTEPHDLKVRMNKTHKELSKGNKVKLVVRFRGREMSSMIPIARGLLDQIHEHVEEIGKYEVRPTIQGRMLVGVLIPK